MYVGHFGCDAVYVRKFFHQTCIDISLRRAKELLVFLVVLTHIQRNVKLLNYCCKQIDFLGYIIGTSQNGDLLTLTPLSQSKKD